jgi:hypothetical protein
MIDSKKQYVLENGPKANTNIVGIWIRKVYAIEMSNKVVERRLINVRYGLSLSNRITKYKKGRYVTEITKEYVIPIHFEGLLPYNSTKARSDEFLESEIS